MIRRLGQKEVEGHHVRLLLDEWLSQSDDTSIVSGVESELDVDYFRRDAVKGAEAFERCCNGFEPLWVGESCASRCAAV